MNNYTLEKLYEVWDDETGDHFEIGPDRDGLDLVEIRLKDKDGKITNRFCFTKDCGILLSEALTLACQG